METTTPVVGSEYVTVVSVGVPDEAPKYEEDSKDYITVLKIGNEEPCGEPAPEEVLVYRLPGEKLGFGLKFEGGTKTAELVRRLFIQSCAVNSPASRVQSSWGPLSEGDEILEIDSVPVNTMTRIDCVRYLKDSNVVIKLLVKHRTEQPLSKFVEDLPLVISAEKKKMQAPPPPPPVPPRKMNRKSKENAIVNVNPPKGFGDSSESPVPLARQSCHEANNISNNLRNRQSPYNSMRKLRQSPEVIKKVRKLSDDGSCPPDAEVYTDLFTQESAYSLSESDDTGSTISTVVDRFGSYPTTTTSSFAGSLPSTPTPVQRHIDISDDIDFSSDGYLYSKLVTSQGEEDIEEKDAFPKQVETNPPLQPPVNFQDAPLSYGNEDVKILKTVYDGVEAVYEGIEDPPSPPPRVKIGEKKKTLEEEILIVQNLPRLVDFVPKSSPIRQTSSIEIVKHFLENEKSNDYIIIDDNDNHIDNSWCEDNEFYSLDWNHSSKLATIGEDEEEVTQDEFVSANIENPVVIIENADTGPSDESGGECANKFDYDDTKENGQNDLESDMEIPPIYSRQPPDGHESPDFNEVIATEEVPIVEQISEKPPPVKPREIWKTKDNPPANNVRSKIAIFSHERPMLAKKYVSTENITLSDCESNLEDQRKLQRRASYQSVKTQSNLDLSAPPKDEKPFPRLTSRSFSLSDVSGRQDKLNMMVEQRKKCLSRLKELVIPENIPEIENTVQPFVDIPEIKSDINVPSLVPTFKPTIEDKFKSELQPDIKRQISTPMEFLREKKKPPMPSRPSSYSFSTSTTTPSPSYPSLLRKLQKVKSIDSPTDVCDGYNHTKPDKPSDLNDLPNLTINVPQNDPPKSLESITSPTRSDYSFEYIYAADMKKTTHEFPEKVTQKPEEESDNDSALSSSQSSYISKNSPPTSPINLTSSIQERKTDISAGSYDSLNRRFLKPQSVEAINRKNILASARVSSGKDFKVGSPLIQRKFDDEEKQTSKNNQVNQSIDNHADQNSDPPSVEMPEKLVSTEDIVKPKPVVEEPNFKVEEPILKMEERNIKVEEPNLKVEKPNFKVEVKVEVKAVEPVLVKPVVAKPEKVKNEVLLKKRVIPEFKEIKPSSKPIQQSKFGIKSGSKSASVNDLRKNFEKEAPKPTPRTAISASNNIAEPTPAKRISLPQISLRSTTPTIENHSVDIKKIKETVLAEYEGTVTGESLKIVVLKPDVSGGSIGITLAGGADYETKEITIHKIRNGSPAHRDGRLQKGDRILMINGKTMKELSHSQSLKILKENVPDVIIAACKMPDVPPASPTVPSPRKRSSIDHTSAPLVAEEASASKSYEELKVSILKDAAGLGFSIQGGQDSPQGNMPLTIKKLFVGGAAEKSSQLQPGDEIIAINDTDTRLLTRIEVWNLMKKLPNAAAVISIRRPR